MLRTLLVLAAIGTAMFFGGFFHFARTMPEGMATTGTSGDAIVVLTGAPARIAAGFRLLEAKRGERMLISGVYPATTRDDIQRIIEGDEALFECCVDIDHNALDTLGNAKETRAWSERFGFEELVIVTSTYHMPRSMMELHRAIPDKTLIPYPVAVSDVPDRTWWRNPGYGRVYMAEYAKYVFALIRNRVDDLT